MVIERIDGYRANSYVFDFPTLEERRVVLIRCL